METHTTKFKVRLGLFIAGGLALFIIAIFIIGKQKNLFNPVYTLTTTFYNVSGLQVGNNVRFSGINVGTVDNIKIINDSSVQVDMLIRKSVQQFIKTDCEAAISSAGIIGDRVLVITQGSNDAELAKDGQEIASKEPVETDAIMASLKITADNAAIVSSQLAEILLKVNNGKGTLGRLIEDSTIAENINQTVVNLKNSSKGLNENMNAAKENFLLRGYYKRKEKAIEKVNNDTLVKKAAEQKLVEKLKNSYAGRTYQKWQAPMWCKHTLIIFLVSIPLSNFTIAQQSNVKTDSTRIYKNIETYSKGSKFKMFMYHLFFKPVSGNIKRTDAKKKGYKKLIQKPYSTFEGKIIRKIDIVTLDPFGYSSNDTTVVPQKFLSETGNKLHIKTQSITIRNLLLIHENEPFNSLRVKESERLIRNQQYVHDVTFYVVGSGGKSDSVDIFIHELDKWSIIPGGAFSTTGIKVDLTEENFLGSGHKFQNSFARNTSTGINAYNTTYSIPNFRNTFINATLHYAIDGYNNSIRSFAVDRPFFSPFAKWAGGILFTSQSKLDSLKDLNSAFVPFDLKFKTQDYWGGVAQRILKGSTETERITNLILAFRYLHIKYSEKPPEVTDPFHIYSDENFYLASVGISTRKYVQDRYVFKYGVTEDVPVGSVYELTGGYQVKNNSGRPYLGMRFSWGSYNEWGYMSSGIEYGTFFHSSHTEQGVITAGLNYFTGMIEFGKWKFRQFVKPQVIFGLKRFSYDSLTLNNGYGIDGFNSPSLSGTRRILLTLQTQSYSPYNLSGFHFGPFLVYSMGIVGNSADGFRNSKMYSLFGLGVQIKNENLVFNTFQISISFYPVIPGRGQNIFKGNSFRTTDFGFRDFEIGKPGQAIYQ